MIFMDNVINEFIQKLYVTYGTLDITKLIESHGIEIRYVPFLKNPYGQSVNILGEKVILVSDEIQESNSRYFVLAHEFFHSIYHIDLAGYYVRDTFSRGKLEKEANKFAAALFINKYVEDFGALPHSYKDLTYLYGVPEELIDYYT